MKLVLITPFPMGGSQYPLVYHGAGVQFDVWRFIPTSVDGAVDTANVAFRAMLRVGRTPETFDELVS